MNGIAIFAILALLMFGIIAAESGSSETSVGSTGSGVGIGNGGGGVGTGGGAGGGITTTLQVSPSSQVTTDGTAVYKIVITDPHPFPCVGSETVACVLGFPSSYTYKLKFESSDSVKGYFDKEEVVVKTGGSETVTLKVKTEKIGWHSFIVEAKTNDITLLGKGSVTYLGGSTEPNGNLFVGKGFVLGNGERNAKLVEMTVLGKDGVLSGKISVGQENFKIKGSFSELAVDGVDFGYTSMVIDFDLISPKTGEVVGSFEGNVKELDNFKLLRGTLTHYIEDQVFVWSLTAFGKSKPEVIGVPIGEGSTTIETEVNGVVSFGGSGSSSEGTSAVAGSTEEETKIYIRPVKIESKKIFWFIPNGKKVKIEIVKGEEVTESEISENSDKVIEGYKVSVGSLEDEGSIEIEVEQE